MKLIKAYQQVYGKLYGVLVFAAFIYFVLVGLFWNYIAIKTQGFNLVALIFTLVFVALIFLKHRLATLIVGIIGLFFSIVSFLGVLASHEQYKAAVAAGNNEINFMIVFSVINVVMFLLLIFSYLRAHVQNPE
ncbi:MAG: hypothetical protein ACTHJ0_13250 [Flavipsychrobacter sp.]